MEERRVEAGLSRGHAVLPHTADVIVEGWGASKVAAFAEVAQAMVDVFAETTGAEATEPLPVSIAAGPDDEMLVALLEEVIFVAEVFAKVPVDIRLEETEEGGLAGFLDVAPVAEVSFTGAAPKAVSRSGLDVIRDGRRWVCRATIDV